LYTQMLEQAVLEIKGEAGPTRHAQIDLGFNIRISNEYDLQENQRPRLYKKMEGVETEHNLTDMRNGARDCVGEPSPPVQRLLEDAAMRLQAMQAGVTASKRKRDLITVKFREDAPIDPGKLASFVSSQRGAQFLPEGTLKFSAKALAPGEVLEQLQGLLG